jgi:hypothetical protein
MDEPVRIIMSPTRYGKSLAMSEYVETMMRMFKPMNKFAPVAPIHILEAFKNRGYVPDNILLLAHDVVKQPERFEALFQAWNETHIIMDNSVIELGGAVDIGMCVDACKIVDADVMVLPDSLTDGVESAKLTISSWDPFKTVFDPMGVELLAVVQGETEKGFFSALELLANEISPEWISIPRRTEAKFGYHRKDLIDFVDMFFPNASIHLLGFSEYPWQDIRAAQHPRVRSIDSAAPLRVKMPFSDPGPSRGDWWETAEFSMQMLESIQEVNALIQG